MKLVACTRVPIRAPRKWSLARTYQRKRKRAAVGWRVKEGSQKMTFHNSLRRTLLLNSALVCDVKGQRDLSVLFKEWAGDDYYAPNYDAMATAAFAADDVWQGMYEFTSVSDAEHEWSYDACVRILAWLREVIMPLTRLPSSHPCAWTLGRLFACFSEAVRVRGFVKQ
jgi:hypothetical protein